MKMTMKEREESGLVVCSQTEMRIYIKVAYVSRYDEPDESDWGRIAGDLSKETGMRRATIKEIFKKCRSGERNPEKQKKGAGRVVKLKPDNKGLAAAATAINLGASRTVATEICNTENAELGISVSRNTLMATIKKYTDVDSSAVDRCNTGN
jgi:hypothetical protein